MKKIFRLFAVLAVCVTTFLLTACDDTVPTITVQNAIGIRDKITLDFTIWDEDEVLTELSVALSGKVDGEDYSTSQKVSISGGSYASDDDVKDGVDVGDFIGEVESLNFINLDSNETYSLVFTATYNDKVKKITPTIDSGKDINLSKITTIDTGTEEFPHQISSVDDFDIIRNDPDGFFELTNDIDLNNAETDPFFSTSKKFVGGFDGKGNTIKNFKQDSYDAYAGLFGYVDEGAVVEDLIIEDVNIFSSRHVDYYGGAFAGYNAGTVKNVSIYNVEIGTHGPGTGSQYIGGFVGYAKGTSQFIDCTIDGVTLNLNSPASSRIGGFVGTNESLNVDVPLISNCTATNVVIDVQIPSVSIYTSGDDKEINYAIGGFAGDNRGLIENSSVSVTEVLVYVEGTETDVEFNEKDTDSEETVRNENISKMDLYIGGFAGANFSGEIIGSESDTKLTVEVAYLDNIYAGGFLGYNDYLSFVDGCSMTGNDFTMIVGENTHLATEGNDIPTLVGSTIGVDNTYYSSSISFDSATTFYAKVRKLNNEDVYVFEDVTLRLS